MRNLFVFFILLALFSVCAFGQNKCFTKEEVSKVIDSLNNLPMVWTEDIQLRDELLKMIQKRDDINQKITENFSKNQQLIPEFNKLNEENLLRLCQIIKEKGWLTKERIRSDGVQAVLSIIQNNQSYSIQTEFYPILVEASKKDYIPKSVLASIVDNVRVAAGQPQIFGTNAKIRGDLIYISPLLNEEKVDEWRKQYDLAPMNVFIKKLELEYVANVLKSPQPSVVPNLQANIKDTSILGISNDENEVLKIDTNLVNLNVRILSKDSNKDSVSVGNLNLSKEDFTVLEDGKEQEVSFFSTTEVPFDLVLVLDFSGSTADKIGLIKEAAKRFVSVARPNDRIAIVAFTHEIELVSNLTTDHDSVIKKIKEINMTGGSWIWGAVKYTYDNIIKKESVGRRSAMVLMTDANDGTRDMTYADLFEIVRSNDTTIFPVYLNNENKYVPSKVYYKARQSLSLLAEETGGTVYQAKKIKDLSGIYEQIVNDLGKVYSVGYEPKNENRDGGWRTLTVKIKTRPDLIARTRRGYYAK